MDITTRWKEPIRLSPPQILVLGFAGTILAGALLLSLPVATVPGQETTFLDALFTATSAVCVTGLVVVDTGTHWTIFGQIVILLLIQVGGLGFMTMATLFALIMGKKIGLRERLVIQEALNQVTLEGLVRLVRYVLLITLIFELGGAIFLAIPFVQDFGWGRGLYYGLFHAVSAFNNAGFDLLGDFRSLTGYVNDPIVNLVVITLIIFGGLGFPVLTDLYRKRKWRSLSLHTKIVLITTAALLFLGTLGIFSLEYTNPRTLGALGPGGKVLAAFFQGVTPRTAGFNTLDIAALRDGTAFLIVILMFIGASPSSTGGGIKTVTFATLVTAVWSMARGREDVEIFERRIPREIIFRALTITLLALGLVVLVTLTLTIFEQKEFLDILFEVTSAFGTVGLSRGITPDLSTPGRIMIIMTMFWGRLGPLTVAFALAQKGRQALIRRAEEKIMVG